MDRLDSNTVVGLDTETKMLLLRFVCTFAWTDLELHPLEREAILGLVKRLGMDDEAHRAQIDEWLRSPPPVDEVDPQSIPSSQRDLFLDVCQSIIEADGVIHDEESESMSLLRRILGRDD